MVAMPLSRARRIAATAFVVATSMVAGDARAQAAPPPPPPPTTTPVTTPTGQTAAQQAAAAATGKAVSNQQISDAIQRSGLTEAQVRARLQAQGYDASLADPFFAAKGGGAAGQALSSASPQFTAALGALGILSAEPNEAKLDDTEKEDRANRARATVRGVGGVFGKDIFQRASTAFDPVLAGPVDPSYRLGVGDQIQLIITGDVELAYAFDLRRDGTVVIPQVGQVAIAGLSLDGARALLRQRMSQSYSGLSNGSTQLDLSVSRLRTNAVFVIGEVEEPGVYQVNAIGTVFHALARAGGPTDRGSFRRIELRRAGTVVRTFDLYRYLIDGDGSQDIRLEQGDVIFVPLNTRAVAIGGAIRRPRIFELRTEEGFDALLRYAGGLSPVASSDRVQVDRIVPPPQRAPGFERVKVDVRLDGNIAKAQAFPLVDGDLVTVFSIGDLRRNVVQLQGSVFQPGEYEFREGMTLDTLFARAQGFLPNAIRDRYFVRRLVPATGRTLSLTVPGDSAPRFALAEFDEVEVLDGLRDYPLFTVAVTGAVNRPEGYPYLQSESLRDLVDRAGGFTEGALHVEVAQRRVGTAFSDTTSIVTVFNVLEDFGSSGRANRFMIQPQDRVSVRLAAGYRPQRAVQVRGAFAEPGAYAINEQIDRLSVLVQRAGGTLPVANLASARLIRSGLPVAIDFEKALRKDPAHDVRLLDGDALVIDADAQVVRVQGAVARASLLRWDPKLSVTDYIERAGGVAENGVHHRAVVESPAGISRRVRRVLWTVKVEPTVVSGAVITVPVKPESKTTAQSVFATLMQSASVIASLAIALAATRR